MNNFFDKLDNAQKVLVGVGKGFSKDSDKESIIDYYNKLAKILSEKDYFIIDVSDETYIKQSNMDMSKVVIPLDKEISEEDGEARWNAYTKWLQMTLNKELFIIELGVGFDMPTLVRWPFEKVTMINNKGYLYRVNENFPQLPDDIKEKGYSEKSSISQFLETVYAERYGN